MKKKPTFSMRIIVLLLAVVIWGIRFNLPEEGVIHSKLPFHEGDEGTYTYNDLFASSHECFSCHGFDTAGVASVDADGNDINLVDQWKGSMMANSAVDPFWKAKVSHEVLLYPEQKNEIESSCTDCHAPLGFFNAEYIGHEPYTMADLSADSTAVDGVSCLACHQRSPENLEGQMNGQLNFEYGSVAYGQYESPLVTPMFLESGYVPLQGMHIQEAALCAGCHTLITETLDELGNPVGNSFVEQATYHEWLNSIYSEINTTCQDCHMPTVDDPVYLAAGYETEPRSPFSKHDFAGANVQMLRMLKSYRDTLQLEATSEQFDYSIEKTHELLQESGLELGLELMDWQEDSVTVSLVIENLAGHRFPSGYPSRRLVVEFIALNETGDTLFHSGRLHADGSVENEDYPYEVHHAFIYSEDQVQIYEMVMGDAEGEVTTVLNRAYAPLKDNRLVPLGFNSSHPVYDTTQLFGDVLLDEDFNKNGVFEGSGIDRLPYQFPISSNDEVIHIFTNIYYQSLHPRWLNEMLEDSTLEIDLFASLLDEQNMQPILIRSVEETFLNPVGAEELADPKRSYLSWRNIAHGMVEITLEKEALIEVFSLDGKRVFSRSSYEGVHVIGREKLLAGMYIFSVLYRDGSHEQFKTFIASDL
jgi:hypothetical protein